MSKWLKGITSTTVKEIKGVLGKCLVIPEHLSSSGQGDPSEQALLLTGLDWTLLDLYVQPPFPLRQAEAGKAVLLKTGPCSGSAATSRGPQCDMSGHSSQHVSGVCH